MPDVDGTLTSDATDANSTATAAEESASQETEASDPVATSADAGAADAASPPEDGTGSLTAGAETPDKPTPAAKPEYTPEQAKRWREQAAGFTKAQQRAIDLERKHQELAEKLAKYEQAQQSTSLPMWDKRSPQHSVFSRALERRNDLNRWLAGAKTPEQQDYIRGIAQQEFTPELRAAIHGYEAHLEQQTREFLTDPRSAMEKMIQEFAPQLIDQKMGAAAQSYQQMEAVNQQVGSWFKDPANADVVKSQQEFMEQELQKPGANWDVVRLQAELRHWKSRVSGATQAAQSAEEKERLLRGNAGKTITSSPKSAGKVDPYKSAKEKGITIGSSQWYDHLENLSKLGLID